MKRRDNIPHTVSNYIFIILTVFFSALPLNAQDALAEAQNFNDIFTKKQQVTLCDSAAANFSILPMLQAVTADNEFFILDRINVRNVFLFCQSGRLKRKYGDYGSGQAKFRHPHSLFYSDEEQKIYINDTSLQEIFIYAFNGMFNGRFKYDFFMDSFIVSGGHIFCYSSTRSFPNTLPAEKLRKNLLKINRNGEIIEHFGRQSSNYYGLLSSEGGGIILLNDNIYNVNVYEYKVQVYNKTGKKIHEKSFNPPNYIPPPPEKSLDKNEYNNMFAMSRLHAQWTSIPKIINIGENLFGVVYRKTNPENRAVTMFLDILREDLSVYKDNMILPKNTIDIHGGNGMIYLFNRKEEKSAAGKNLVYTIETYNLDDAAL